MSKYRLSYLSIGGIYKDIDLSKLDCLKNFTTTDIEIIDAFTTNFNNEEELLLFLKHNKIIEEDVNKLYITIDKKIENNKINKKIYNGETILLKKDFNLLNISFIYKWIMENKDNEYYIKSIANNYIEKYKNAYNRINGSSYILTLFNNLKYLIINKNNKTENEILKEYEKCISDFIDIEFYKIDKDILSKEKRILKKKDKDGKYLKSYRNIHDFVILINTLDYNLQNDIKTNNLIELDDNEEIKTLKEHEEFLTYEDYQKTNEYLLKEYKERLFIPYREGNDYISPISKEELKDCLDEQVKTLCKK